MSEPGSEEWLKALYEERGDRLSVIDLGSACIYVADLTNQSVERIEIAEKERALAKLGLRHDLEDVVVERVTTASGRLLFNGESIHLRVYLVEGNK